VRVQTLTIRDFPVGRFVFFVSGNVHKFNEVRRVLAECGIASAMLRVKTTEIQDDNVENIAKVSALEASKKSNLPLIVEDAGLFIRALKGFPGPYSSYVLRTIGNEGVLKIMASLDDQYAQFHSAVVFCSSSLSVKCFLGVSEGKIAQEARGSSGFGFDPIFEPSEGGGRTFAEMSMEEKNMFSHRSRALRKFGEWYKSASSKAFKYEGNIALKEPSETLGG